MLPWDPLVDVLVERLRKRIESGFTDTRAVQLIPLVCREARDEWRMQPHAPWLVMYQLHVSMPHVCMYTTPRLYDSVPSSIDLEGDESSHSAQHTPHESWSLDSVQAILEARRTYARAVHERRTEETHYGHPDRWLATSGIPERMPMAVRRLVGFMRFLMHQSTLPVCHQPYELGLDEQCARKGCTRRASSVSNYSSSVSNHSSLPYWQLCNTGSSLYSPGHSPFSCDHLSFCCQSCHQQTRDEFQRLVCCFSDLDSIEHVVVQRTRRGARGPPTHGERQLAAASSVVPPARLFRAALQRNEAIRRRMTRSCVVNTEPVHLPMDSDDTASLRRGLVVALNVDTALLYAASVLHELPPGRRPRKTMPICVAWRRACGAETSYCQAAMAIRRVLLSHSRYEGHTDQPLLTSGSTQPRWLQRVKDSALSLF